MPLEGRDGQFHWAVLTLGVIPGSRNKTYAEQQRLMPAGYEVPPILGVALAIFWGLLSEPQRSQESPFFTNDPPTYTYCKEAIGVYQSIVGGFIPDRGLRVDRTIEFGTEDVGIAGWQEFWY